MTPQQERLDTTASALLLVALAVVSVLMGGLGGFSAGFQISQCSTAACRSTGADWLGFVGFCLPLALAVVALVVVVRRRRAHLWAWWVPLVTFPLSVACLFVLDRVVQQMVQR